MPNPFDAALKDLLTPNVDEVGDAFGLPRTRPAVVLNVDLSTISAATDVTFGYGEPLQEVVDLNFQSGPDPNLDARCHLYSAALHHRFHVPVRTILVLLRPKAESGKLDGKLTYTSGASGVEFRYEVIRMWEQSVDKFLHGGVHLLPLAMPCHVPPARPLVDGLREIVATIDQRLAKECNQAQGARLMTAALVLTGLRVSRDRVRPIFEGVRPMQQDEMTAYDYYVEQGAINEAQRMLLLQGQKRFERPDESTLTAFKEIRDLDRLERMGEAMMTASSWKDLLATL